MYIRPLFICFDFKLGEDSKYHNLGFFFLNCHNSKVSPRIPYKSRMWDLHDTTLPVAHPSHGRLLKIFGTCVELLRIVKMGITCCALLADATTHALLVWTTIVTHPSNAWHIKKKPCTMCGFSFLSPVVFWVIIRYCDILVRTSLDCGIVSIFFIQVFSFRIESKSLGLDNCSCCPEYILLLHT